MSIIGAEDEDFENDLEPNLDGQCSHFNNIEQVKMRPTHLLVFLQHVMLQFDCAPLLCYLHADLFKNYNAKETKKQFLDFYNTFLDKGAILRVPVPLHISYELDRTRPDLISEETQKRYTQEVQNLIQPEVTRQLEDFRTKRMMGMTRHESELLEVESHRATERIPTEMKEKAVAETLLDKMADGQPTVGSDEEKFTAIFGAVVSYMKHLGVKTKATDNKKSKGFFRKIHGMRKNPISTEDSTRSKQRFPGNFSDTIRWIGGSNEIKTGKLETEGEKEKVAQDRKSSTGHPPSLRTVGPDPTPTSLPKKPASTATTGTLQVTDGNDVSGVSISVTSSPDSSQSEIALISRSDPPSASEGGEVSPAIALSSINFEPTPATDTPPEENQEKDRMSGRLARSESLCVERRRSQRGGSARAQQSRSRSDVDLQAAITVAHPLSPSQPHTPLGDGGASVSNSSLTGPVVGPPPPQEEVEPRLLELEQDPPNWREQAPSANLQSLNKKEIKRQEVINELFVTEHAHVRMLSVLQMVFFRPMEHTEVMTGPELNAIFPNLDDIFEMHYAFYENLKKLRQEDNYIVKTIAKTLLNRFSGPEGEWFQKLTARFCSHQSYALDQIKTRQRRDPRFGAFIQEAEGKPQCRRLQLKDIIPTEMQRLTKYPLLLENIAKSTEDQEEKAKVHQAAECCRKILNHVNEAVKEMENLLTLKDYQRRLDTSGLKPSNDLYQEYKNIDLTQRRMIFEGPVTWKVTKEKSIEVQCVLLGDLLVLLQRQDDKMLLKCQSKNHSGVPEGKQMLSPIIKLSSVFLREVATDQKAFYVIFTWDSGAQIYELVANSTADRKNWTELIKSAVEELKHSGGTSMERRRTIPSAPSMGGIPFSPTNLQAPLNLTENGSGARNANADHDKCEAKGEEHRHMLIDYLSANGFELLCHGNTPQEKVASGAVDEVAALKRLFVGSHRELEAQELENQEEVFMKKEPEMDGQPPAEGDSVDGKTEAESREDEDGGEKGKEDNDTATPLVLSLDTVAEVLKRLTVLEQQLKQLQSVEEEHHRLQDLLCKFSISGDHFQ